MMALQSGSRPIFIVRYLARLLLRLGGWEVVGEIPSSGRYVLIAAPHTSNWDFVWTMATAIVLRVELNWFAKHSLFKPGIGALFRRWGGIPIERQEVADRVSFMAGQLREAQSMVVLVAAEGTRSLAPYWKSGFYHIARQANVPIVLGFLDYGKRRVGFGPAVATSEDVVADMDQIRAFYSGIVGKYPALAGPIRLRDESASGD
jgi:1-acyl-sn-glycerol-3-phosphate acyltransferase